MLSLLLLASGHSTFAQREELETALERSAAFGQRAFHATLPIALGWFNGEPCLYISTDASDADVAGVFRANPASRHHSYVPSRMCCRCRWRGI